MKFINIRLLIIVSITLLFSTGCDDFLDKPASDDITIDIAYKDLLSSKEILNNLYWETQQGSYNVLYREIPYAQACEDAVPGFALWGNFFHNGSWTAEDDPNAGDYYFNGNNVPPTCSFWKSSYRRIRKANLFLQNITGVEGDEDTKIMYEAEAHFIRAFFYSELVKRFGGVIIEKEATDDYSSLLTGTRSSFNECVNWIVSELDKAAMELPTSRINSEIGRATKGMCYAVKARLLLFAASPLFNTDNPVLPSYDTIQYYGDYKIERWKDAADACMQVMNLGVYDLYEGDFEDDVTSYENYYARYSNLFFTYSKEAIWINYPLNPAWDIYPFYNRSVGGWNWTNPTLELAEQFEMLNGKLPNDPESGYDFRNPNVNRDPRFKATIQYPGAVYPAYSFEPWIGGSASHLESQKTGMCTQKFVDENYSAIEQGLTARSNIIQTFRYAEILLNYAEATNEYSGPSTEVYEAVNAIRERVGMPDLPVGLSQSEMRQKIWHERRVEFAFEDFRFFDVRRWRIAENTENGSVHGYDVTKGKDSGFWNVVEVGSPHVFLKKHYLYPISTQELLLNSNLVQNPGW